MKTKLCLASSLLLLGSPSAMAIENYLFAYTHLLTSPFTIPVGKIAVGTATGIGITDFFDLQTNLVSDFFQIYNAKARFSLVDFKKFAAGIYLGYQNVNLNHLAPTNPSLTISAWMPGGTIGVEVAPYLAVFFGFQFFYPGLDIVNSAIKTSGYLEGAQGELDVSWAYNPHGSRIGNAVSAGITYNATFAFFGIGVSHHWPGFHLGLHYYPDAQNLRALPIFSAGGTFEL